MRGSIDADRKFSVTSVLQDGDVPQYDDGITDDDRVLMSLGYKAEFKREFGLWQV